ncbi:hypothetical protein JCM8547_002392 [Rhodosporidiobolus lusitaniae]
MNARKSAATVPSTLSRQLRGSFLKNPPPAFAPLLAHPPPPSLVRSFPSRDTQDLPAAARRAPSTSSASSAPSSSLYLEAKRKLDQGLRLTAQEDAALLDPSQQQSSSARATRRKPPRAANTKDPRPWAIVFPEDGIRKRFFEDHPFEAYRPVSLVEGEKVQEPSGPQGKAWTELSQRSTIPSAEDCIAFIHNLVVSHNLPLSRAYPHGVSQFRTLRSEHELASRSAFLQAQSFGATFFGELDKTLAVEERVLDEWVNAREIQNSLAAGTGGSAGAAAAAMNAGVQAESGHWAPREFRPAHVLGEDESVFTGGVEYRQAFEARRGVASAAVSQGEGKLVGVEAA